MSKYIPVIHLPGESKKELDGYDDLYEACAARTAAWEVLPNKAIKTLMNANTYKDDEKTKPKEYRQIEVK